MVMTVSSRHAAGRSSGVVLTSLLLGTFIAGSAELLPVGLLPMISAGLGVSVAAAGGLVGAYALGLAIGGPLLTAMTMRLDRRHVLVGSLAIFVILVVSPAAIPNYEWFVVTRLGAGAMQGLFMTVAFMTATSVVPADRAGRALSVVIAGFAISTVVGLPLGVVAGSVLGWRGALLAVAGIALAVAILLYATVPALPGSRPVGAGELRHAFSPPVLVMLGLSLVLFAAPAAVMTYVIPLLEQVLGVSGPSATAVLLGYGMACVAGSFLGGRLADTNAARALVLAALGVTTSLVILYAARSQPMFAVVAIFGWALFSSIAPPSVQQRTVSLAGPGAALAASLPASAASAGIALGSTASGFAYTASGPSAVIVTGIVIALGSLALAIATRRLRPRPATTWSTPAVGLACGQAADRQSEEHRADDVAGPVPLEDDGGQAGQTDRGPHHQESYHRAADPRHRDHQRDAQTRHGGDMPAREGILHRLGQERRPLEHQLEHLGEHHHRARRDRADHSRSATAERCRGGDHESGDEQHAAGRHAVQEQAGPPVRPDNGGDLLHGRLVDLLSGRRSDQGQVDPHQGSH